MIQNVFAPELAAARQQQFLTEADAFRRARSARPAVRRPTVATRFTRAVRTFAVNRAGVRIRPIRPSDADLLRGGFDRLSPQSRRLRFLSPKHELSAAEVRYFTDVDHHDHEALVAVSRIGGRGIGVARFVRIRDEETTADVAVTVVDAWQGRGLGTELVARLAVRARQEGIWRFTALMSSENQRARRLLRTLGGPVTVIGRDAGTVLYEVGLVSPERSPAAGRLRVGAASPLGAACVTGTCA